MIDAEFHDKNYNEKIYLVECKAPDWKIWMRWTGFRKGRQALDSIRDLRKGNDWKFRIKTKRSYPNADKSNKESFL